MLSRVFVLLCSLACVAPAARGDSLDSLIENSALKFIFVGGKGGVGKTTTSSAIAAQLSLSLIKGNARRVLLISTDPAHSLSDAFRMQFSNTPTAIAPHLPNLEVLEINSASTMEKELSSWVELAQELGYNPDSGEDSGVGIGEKIHSFQEWLGGIPGIDEATALNSAITHIESGRYDTIVFDTAPTGHTLKLLELPKILQVGLDKLEGWQATLWGYWDMAKGLVSGSADAASVKEKVSVKLREYKASMARVGGMLVDQQRTRFVVVCIAEHLSIHESRRLLSELERNEVPASHVVVNQLVVDFLDVLEMEELEALAIAKEGEPEGAVLAKALAASKLTSARQSIQGKYLGELRRSPEVKSRELAVLEVPLLAKEVGGAEAIVDFSTLLISEELRERTAAALGKKASKSGAMRDAEADAREKAGARRKSKKQGGAPGGDDMKQQANAMIDKVMEDPELKAMVDENPKLQDILVEVKANPMAGMKYMMDPEVSPFIQKAMAKMGGTGMPGGGGMPDLSGLMGNMAGGKGGKGGRRKKGKKAAADPMSAMMGMLGGLAGKGGGKGGMPDLSAMMGGKGGGKGGMPDLSGMMGNGADGGMDGMASLDGMFDELGGLLKELGGAGVEGLEGLDEDLKDLMDDFGDGDMTGSMGGGDAEHVEL